MPSGDITDGLVAKVRGILNETSAGFWTGDATTDGVLQKYLDMAQKWCLTFGYNKQKEMQKIDKHYELEYIKPALKASSAITLSTSSNVISLSSITDLMYIYGVELFNSTDLVKLQLNYVPLHQLIWDAQNSYGSHSYNNTTHKGDVYFSYYNGGLLTSFTTLPYTYLNRCIVYYYPILSTLTKDVDPILPVTVHEVMIELALSYAWEQAKQYEKATRHFQKGLQLLNSLQ